MATSRFACHTTEDISVKISKTTPQSTKNSNGAAAKILREYLEEKKQDMFFENYTQRQLAEVLTHFYLDVRTKDGKFYKATSLESIRHGLNRYLKAPPHSKKFDIMKDNEFLEANESFKTAMKELKSEGFGKIDHYPEINTADRQKLYSSLHLSPCTPYGLLNKVQFDVRLYFCRRGSENMEKMTKATFVVKTDNDTGIKYVMKSSDELTKNHKTDKENVTGFMPEERGSVYCPVSSYEKYISKLNKKCDRLWQYPRDSYCDDDTEWYSNKPIGRDSLAGFMTKLSAKCGLSQKYTNHSIRATGATILSRKNFAASQIMAVTGHKSVSSLTVYQLVSDQEKLQMGLAMTNEISPTASSMNPRMALPSPPVTTCNNELTHSKWTTGSNQAIALPEDLHDVNLDQLFCDFNTPITSNLSLEMQNQSNQSAPLFMNCSFGTVNITVNK